ncbi:hypothetical protein F441_19065 [Phytophthora nicotianae CJ01A1]|uniref:Temptin Cys/Cys disulfide domain-containing protein n=4 Tax=Phytophthora nicotianae TaxID=4792 RepID=W2QZ84_PHYN3|nr:hypothetical protein PPTG_05355 [Phytophthora nicotianae INRA-310]ETK74541.1 hypothetical protein L915_18676 [Phytophthora nicotianae]ETP04078.1 hypothetical protein F441_19065 [Phytophthora nicotianae CJ01A1]ETP32270.1 hypothetical protein F442_19027 [Phytophthora nicotianae P10297]ETL27962.1 hypothetical protein L916_18581 [Phytophthora nicotianae]ETM34411.1 hypothetical protein L914_18491 [Phytophthora nicotianae]
MKTQVIIATAALTIAATMDSVSGLAKYLNEIPNGSLFQQSLGHIGGDSSKTTPFAEAFAAADHTWSSSLCEAKFPGSSMTNGAAFGDPCCTWKKGGKPDFTVTAFTTTPGKATTCASKGGSSGTSSGAGASGAADATKGGSSGTTESSGDGAANATKGGTTDTTESSGDGAADATKGGTTDTTESSDTGASDASTGTTTGGSPSGAGDATKGSPWGSSTTPTSGGGCAAKRTLRR